MAVDRCQVRRRVYGTLPLLGLGCWILGMSISPAVAQTTLDERRARLEQLDSEAKERLAQNYDRFGRLTPDERDRLRNLETAIAADADAEALRRTMQRYDEWLNNLPLSLRAELAALAPAERLKRIDEIRAEQQRRDRMRLASADLDALDRWLQEHEPARRWLESTSRRPGPGSSSGQGPGPRPEMPEPAAWVSLRDVLSDDAKRRLDEAETPEAKARLIGSWWFQLRRRAWAAGGGMRRWSDEEIAKFLQERVSTEERARLLSLPHDEMREELRRLLARQMSGSRSQDGRPGGPGRGSGERGPGDRGPDERRPGGPGERGPDGRGERGSGDRGGGDRGGERFQGPRGVEPRDGERTGPPRGSERRDSERDGIAPPPTIPPSAAP